MHCNFCDFAHAQEKTLCDFCGVFNGVAAPVEVVQPVSAAPPDVEIVPRVQLLTEQQALELEVSNVTQAACRYLSLLCNASFKKITKFVAAKVDTTAMALVLTVEKTATATVYDLSNPRVLAGLILMLVSVYSTECPAWFKPDFGLLFESGISATVVDRILGSCAVASPPSLRLRSAVIGLDMVFKCTESHPFTVDLQRKLCTAMKAQLNTYTPSLQGTCADALCTGFAVWRAL
jgi:hypothetical protein